MKFKFHEFISKQPLDCGTQKLGAIWDFPTFQPLSLENVVMSYSGIKF